MRVTCKLGTVGLILALGFVFGCKSEPAPEQTEKKAEQKAEQKAEAKAEAKAEPKGEPGKEEPKPAVDAPKEAAAEKPVEAAPTGAVPATTGVPLAADVLPNDVAAVVGTFAASEWLKILASVGVTSERILAADPEFKEALDLLEADPLTEEGLAKMGLDTSRSPLIAFVSGAQTDALAIIALPMLPGKSGVELLKQLMPRRKPEDLAKITVEEGKQGDVRILWLTKNKENPELAGVLDMAGYWIMIFASEGHAEQTVENAEVRALVTRVADASTPRLSSTPGFKETVAGMEGSILQVYASYQGALPMMLKDRDSALFASWLANFAGGAMWVKEDGNAASLVVRTFSNQPTGLFGKRDVELAKIVPVEPLIGIHGAVNASKAVELLERGLASDKGMIKDYQEGMAEAWKKVGLPETTRIDELWNGELGFFMGMITKDESALVRSMAGFLGVADETKVRTAIDTLVKAFDKRGDVVRETVGEVPVWRVKVGPMDMAMVVTGNRLWYLGDASLAAGLVRGEPGKLAATERGAKLSSIMAANSPKVMFVDLQKLMLMVLPLLSSGDREDMIEAMPLITALDSATFSLEENGGVDTGTLQVTMTAPVRDTLVKLVQQVVAKEFEKASHRKKEEVRPAPPAGTEPPAAADPTAAPAAATAPVATPAPVR